MEQNPIDAADAPGRWQTIRKLLIFQYKLLIDATKDILLSPLALGAALIDIIRPAPPEQMLFPELMKLGKRAERAINLFGVAPEEDEWTVDRLVDSVEETLRQRYLKEVPRARREGDERPGPGPGGEE